MKHLTKYITFLSVLCLMSSGCESDNHDPEFMLTDSNFQQYTPKTAGYFIGSSSISTYQLQFDYELKPIFDPNQWDIKIDQVVFFVDGTQISSLTQKPYKVKYSISNPAHGNHTVLAQIHVSGKNLSSKTIDVSHVIYNRFFPAASPASNN
ncbi:MAG: hypothetical protein K2O38_03240 [Muribaculaceae bacterium]|nr:hypothetical protein [Muribaculaceae bacterium]MDE7110897.1 hypothetical protein [Muribaculaceae bacterium]